MLKDFDAVILAGGLGTRLRSAVADTPKCLASVNDLPFLMYKMRQLQHAGIRRIILCIGYMAEKIELYFNNNPLEGVSIEYAYEKELLGTAGAFKNAECLIESENFLALNGDCYLDIDYQTFVYQHIQTKAKASLALVRVEDPSRYGLVMFEKSLEIKAFLEKQQIAPATHPEAAFYINAGTYCFNRSLLDEIPAGQPCSLEKEIFPHLIGKGFYAFPLDGYFIDIGTPESFQQIQNDIVLGKVRIAS